MVFFFTTSDGYTIYMGADKYENEDLIKYGLLEDIWFHVDDMSSAHVYLRLRPEQRLEDVNPETIEDCAQLVKANSIEGCKLKEVTVIYTRWRNLHKTASMEVGAIGFHDRSKVKSLRVEKNNVIVNRLNKTRDERFPNLAELQQIRASEFRAQEKDKKREANKKEKADKMAREEAAKVRNYSSVMVEENMTSNKEFAASADDSAARAFEEDFM
jgi:hypothetical protein